MKFKNAEISKMKNGGLWGLNYIPLDSEHPTLSTELLKLAEIKPKIAPSNLCCNAKMVLNSILGTKYSATGQAFPFFQN